MCRNRKRDGINWQHHIEIYMLGRRTEMAEKNRPDYDNEELEELTTHSSGATNAHKTRTTNEKKTINPPKDTSPGPYDVKR